MRVLPVLLAALCWGASAIAAPAQIFEVVFKDEKTASKYSKHMVEIDGRARFLGELRAGATYTPGKGTNFDRAGRSEWFLPNAKDPSSLPYKVTDGVITKAIKKQVGGVQNAHIAAINLFAPNSSWFAIGEEYEQRMKRLGELELARDQETEGESSWQVKHQILLEELEQTRVWLGGFGFSGAMDTIAREMKKQTKVVGREAAIQREKRAMLGIGDAQVAEDVNTSAEQWAAGHKFKMQQSQHCRITYHEGIPDGAVATSLKMAEKAILGFRARFVEPYLSETFPDRIPEHVFIEWYFGPDDMAAHEKMYEEHFGMIWGPEKVQRMASEGSRNRRGGENPDWLYYWRNTSQEDPAGKVANNLGVTLATIHYGTGFTKVSMDWIEEAVGYWVSLEFLGRNVVTNKAFDWSKDDPERTVSGGGKKEEDEKKTVGEGVVQAGERTLYLQSALGEGAPFSALMTTRLFDMRRGDVAKSWAMFEFLVRQDPKNSQIFLREMARFAREGGDFQGKLRKRAEELFEVKGEDVFRKMDRDWEAWVREQLGLSQKH
jgi:hypothetical protein